MEKWIHLVSFPTNLQTVSNVSRSESAECGFLKFVIPMDNQIHQFQNRNVYELRSSRRNHNEIHQ